MKKYALGIDLGGTGTKFGLVSEDGKVLRSSSIPTQQYPDINDRKERRERHLREHAGQSRSEGTDLSLRPEIDRKDPDDPACDRRDQSWRKQWQRKLRKRKTTRV